MDMGFYRESIQWTLLKSSMAWALPEILIDWSSYEGSSFQGFGFRLGVFGCRLYLDPKSMYNQCRLCLLKPT